MRTWPVLGLLAACSGDPTLEVVVTHPTGVTAHHTTVTVYQSASLTCEDIEFARLDDVQLEALAVAEETVDVDGNITGGLTGISRTENKAIVARGFDANDQLLAINCAPKAEVVGRDVVKITTVIAAVVSLKAATSTNTTVGVTLTDLTGQAIDGARPVSWTVYGPVGSSAANPGNVTAADDGVWQPTNPTCANGGSVKLNPNPPSVVGGYAVQVRPAWAIDLPPIYTSLTNADFTVTTVPQLLATSIHFCAIRRKGTLRRIVCIDNTNHSHDYGVTSSNGKAVVTDLDPRSFTPAPGESPVAVVAVEPQPGSTDRDAYAVTNKGVLIPLYGAPAPLDTTSVCPLATTCIDDAIAVPPCDQTKGKVLLHGNAAIVRAIDSHGGNPQAFAVPGGVETRLDNAGCVDQISTAGTTLGQFASAHAGATNAVTGEFNIGSTHLINCTGGPCTVEAQELTRGAAVGFSREHRMIATTVDATGVVLVRAKFTLPSKGIVEDPPRMPAASIPDHVVTGKYDNDTMGLGTVWDVSARIGTSFEVAYHRTIGNTGLPVEALSSPQAGTVVSIQSDDVDGDGNDDLVIMGNGAVASVAVVPMNATILPPTANPDPTCTP